MGAGPSPADRDHGPVLGGRDLKHARVRRALAPHRCAHNQAQVVVRGAAAHRIAQAHLVGTKQADLEVAVRQQAQPAVRGGGGDDFNQTWS